MSYDGPFGMTGQLPLDLPHRAGLSEEDFLEAPSNEKALAMVRLWPDWPQKTLLLSGPQGAGKSHLAAIWARRAGARFFRARDLTLELAPDLANEAALVLENADEVSGESQRPGRETEMFHLLNLAFERGCFMLVVARNEPDLWGLSTPDLLSRLRRAPQVAIESPDERFLRAILVKLFHDRQIRVDESLIDYLSLRLERSFEAAQNIVAALDREGLARGRAVTRPLAARLLAESPGLCAQQELYGPEG
jgi:chromosomal replication initiation ATPase DnaA